MLKKSLHEPFVVTSAIIFHDLVDTLAKNFYFSIFPPKIDVPLETAQSNMDSFTKEVIRKSIVLRDREEKQNGDSLEEKLKTFGDHYISKEDLDNPPSSVLWRSALQYDFKGIVPAPDEDLRDFVYRGNTLLFLHKQLRRTNFEPTISIIKKDVKLGVWDASLGFAKQEDLKEANRRIPYFMDLSWASVYVKDKKDFMVPALGLTFTLPSYNGFNFVQMRSRYKSRERFLSVLAHEMTHVGTVHFDTKRDFLETKAYSVGRGDLMLGEYVVAFNERPPLWMRSLKWVSEYFFLIPFPDKYMKVLPKVKSAMEILSNAGSYRGVRRELTELYGDRGGYILGRLNADEMEEFRDIEDIPHSIASKKDLKWKIMRTNFAKLS